MKTYLKIVPNDWKNASRDKRELSVAKELGYQVIVVAKGGRKDKYLKDNIDNYDVYRFSTRPLNLSPRLNKINRFIAAILWSIYVRNFKADVISCHDFIALFIGYLSTIFTTASKKPALIYDSHEFEIARNTNRSRMQQFFVKKLEGYLIRKTALNIMVNNSISTLVQKNYSLPIKPLVIRNIPNCWDLNYCEIAKCRTYFLNSLDISESGFIIMYHGLICKGNGIDIAIKALARTTDVGLIILGYTHTPEYIDYLKQLIKLHRVESRCLFHDAVPLEALYKYIGAADLGMLTFEAITKSYYYTLPNKFFENIQALTPMICSDFPELRQLIVKYNIGFLCNPSNEERIAELIYTIQHNRELYNKLKKNLIYAKNELKWENEKQILKSALIKLDKD